MNIYQAQTPEERREAAILLCVEMGRMLVPHTSASFRSLASTRVVPPVPQPEPDSIYKKVIVSDGENHTITFEKGQYLFRTSQGTLYFYSELVTMMDYHTAVNWTPEVYAQLYALPGDNLIDETPNG